MQLHESLDLAFHALASSTRRQMLGRLATGDTTAGELGRPFDISQPAASKHIRILERAGLVTRRVHGRLHLFRLEPKVLMAAEDWITRHRDLWNHSLDTLADLLETESTGAKS